MSQYFQWLILTALTGSPVLSAAILVVAWFVFDRFTFGVLPDPIRWLKRLERAWRLSTQLKHTPHDRRARIELAELYVQRKKYAAAIDVLKPAIEAGEHEPAALFTMAVACLGAGHAKQGEALLDEVVAAQPNFRLGEVDLERGRFRLQRKEFAPAKESLRQLIANRKGSVEGRVLLAQALEGEGDDGAAALMRDEAWSEYVAAPRFQRRKERFWAWRARPSRPLMYAVLIGLGIFAMGRYVAPVLSEMGHSMRGSSYGYGAGASPDDE